MQPPNQVQGGNVRGDTRPHPFSVQDTRTAGRGIRVSWTLRPALAVTHRCVARTLASGCRVRMDAMTSPQRVRFGYWTPIFGGWLRNVDDEQTPVSFAHILSLIHI